MSDVSAPSSAADLTPSRPIYDGTLGELYAIYLRHLVLMVLTLGISRFWGRTRLRRYLWNHLAILGDRFEYRGRGIELLIGFVIVLLLLGIWAGLIWAIWEFAFHERSPQGFGILDIFYLSVAFIGFPLALVGQYAALRYKLSRTRWRGIRCSMAGSAWKYGAMATALTFANAFTGQLLLPVVSVTLARPRIVNASVGTQGFEFAGHSGDIYGRYIGYYCLNILAWILAIVLVVAAIGGAAAGFGVSSDDLKLLTNIRDLRTILLIAAIAVGAYLVFSVMILPLRCWWQAYLLRYLVSRTRAGKVLFATALSTRQMWGFLVLNYLIVLLTLGLGWPIVMHRTLRLIASELWLYGTPDGASIRQPPDRGPRFGEGLLEMFDVTGF
ncbi:MAG: YjgN family protein [Reyranellales bacterium]